jgi:hypothetical protein
MINKNLHIFSLPFFAGFGTLFTNPAQIQAWLGHESIKLILLFRWVWSLFTNPAVQKHRLMVCDSNK